MNDTVTILGFIGNDPTGSTTNTGVPVVNFRVASSRRRYDAKAETWVDAGTNWYTVSAYRQLAEHARASLRKGHPVIVIGRLKVREWDNGNGTRGSSLDIDADAIGHDLRLGTSAFVRASRAQHPHQLPQTSAAASDPFAPDGPGDEEEPADPGTREDVLAAVGLSGEPSQPL